MLEGPSLQTSSRAFLPLASGSGGFLTPTLWGMPACALPVFAHCPFLCCAALPTAMLQHRYCLTMTLIIGAHLLLSCMIMNLRRSIIKVVYHGVGVPHVHPTYMDTCMLQLAHGHFVVPYTDLYKFVLLMLVTRPVISHIQASGITHMCGPYVTHIRAAERCVRLCRPVPILAQNYTGMLM